MPCCSWLPPIRPFGWVLLVLPLLVVGGCHSYSEDIGPAMRLYAMGNHEAAAQVLEAKPRRRQDRMLWLLERGKALHDAGRYEESIATLTEAEVFMSRYYQTATIRVSQELFGAVADQYARDYEPMYSDAIMLNALQAMNHLALGDLREARVYLRRASDRQAESLQVHARQVEQRRAELDRAAQQIDHDAYREGLSRVSQAYADFTNPLATYLAAFTATVDGDAPAAEVEIRRLHTILPSNSYVEPVRFEQLRDAVGGLGPGQVVVLVESGFAPQIEPVRLPYATPYTGVSLLAFPRLVFGQGRARGLTLTAGEHQIATSQLASMEGIVATEFHARLPVIVLRIALSQATKEAAAVMMRDQADDAGLLLASAYKLWASNVDDRTWRTLPARFHLAQLDRPEDGRLGLNPQPGVTPPLMLDLPESPVVIVWARRVGSQLWAVTYPVLP